MTRPTRPIPTRFLFSQKHYPFMSVTRPTDQACTTKLMFLQKHFPSTLVAKLTNSPLTRLLFLQKQCPSLSVTRRTHQTYTNQAPAFAETVSIYVGNQTNNDQAPIFTKAVGYQVTNTTGIYTSGHTLFFPTAIKNIEDEIPK